MDRTSVMSRSQTNIPMPQHMPGVIAPHMPHPREAALTHMAPEALAHLPPATLANLRAMQGVSGLGDGSASSLVTPTTVVQRLPSIVNPTPTELGATCDAFTLWVSENPFWALGGLAVIAYFTVLKGK